jgi:futalosine hydrolase
VTTEGPAPTRQAGFGERAGEPHRQGSVEPELIALVCSVEMEMEPLLEQVTDPSPLQIGGKRGWLGRVGRAPVVGVIAGMGKTNAGHALTALFEARAVRALIGFGVAGAYPGSGIEVGGTALASGEHYGDEGVDTPGGWISTEGIGIPLVERDGTRAYNDLPVDPVLLEASRNALAAEGIEVAVGRFVTVSCCSGTEARGRELARRFGAICETMEGAAYAHLALLYGIPFLEVRGISNRVEDRDLSAWKLREAAEAAALAAAICARAGRP